MKTIFKPFTFLLIASFILSTVSAQDRDFRGVNWGMSKAEVKSTENAKVCADPDDDLKRDCICYEEALGSQPYHLYYCFREDKLESAFYRRYEANTNLDALTDLFFGLKIVLEKKYGHDYYMILKEGAGWGEYTMLVDSQKDLENLIKLDEFNVQVVWEKSKRTRVILELQSMKTSQIRSGSVAIRYEPSSKLLLYDDNAFDKDDYDKL